MRFLSENKLSYLVDELRNENLLHKYALFDTLQSGDTVTGIMPNTFAQLHVKGTSYGELYTSNSNLYNPPEGSDGNPIWKIHITKGTIKLGKDLNNPKFIQEIELCGWNNNDDCDEIIGTALYKRWSDEIDITNYITTNDTTTGGLNYKKIEIPVTAFQNTPVQIDNKNATVTSPILVQGYEPTSYAVFDALTEAPATGKATYYYDDINEKYIVCLSYLSPIGERPIKVRFRLSETLCNYTYIDPIILDNGDKISFVPDTYTDYNSSSEHNLNTKLFEISAYTNTAAQVADNHGVDLINNIYQGLKLSSELEKKEDSVVSEIDPEGQEQALTLQEEINKMAETGGTVYIKQGDYTFTESIDVLTNVTVAGIGNVKITGTMNDAPVFILREGSHLKDLIIKTNKGFSSNVIQVKTEDAHFETYGTSISGIKIFGFSDIVVDHSAQTNSTLADAGTAILVEATNNYHLYNFSGTDIKIYNYEYGVRVQANGTTNYISNAFFSNLYIDNCNIGIFDHGYSTAWVGYTVQTRKGNIYGVECYGGYFIGHVYDLDLYEGRDANPGHPRYGYYFRGENLYSYVADPIYTGYQGKYGFKWESKRPENNSNLIIRNEKKIFRKVNEITAPLKENGQSTEKATEAVFDFNGIIDNYIAYAEDKWTVTCSDNVTTALENSNNNATLNDTVFNPFGSYLVLPANVDQTNPYEFEIDFGETKDLSAIGMDFDDNIPRYVEMQIYKANSQPNENTLTLITTGLYTGQDREYYESSENDLIYEKIDGNYYEVVYKNDANRTSVIQATWSGSGMSIATKIRYMIYPDATNDYHLRNLYTYSYANQAEVYLPAMGGKIKNKGTIEIDSSITNFNDNDLVPYRIPKALKSEIDDLLALVKSRKFAILDTNSYKEIVDGQLTSPATFLVEGETIPINPGNATFDKIYHDIITDKYYSFTSYGRFAELTNYNSTQQRLEVKNINPYSSEYQNLLSGNNIISNNLDYGLNSDIVSIKSPNFSLNTNLQANNRLDALPSITNQIQDAEFLVSGSESDDGLYKVNLSTQGVRSWEKKNTKDLIFYLGLDGNSYNSSNANSYQQVHFRGQQIIFENPANGGTGAGESTLEIKNSNIVLGDKYGNFTTNSPTGTFTFDSHYLANLNEHYLQINPSQITTSSIGQGNTGLRSYQTSTNLKLAYTTKNNDNTYTDSNYILLDNSGVVVQSGNNYLTIQPNTVVLSNSSVSNLLLTTAEARLTNPDLIALNSRRVELYGQDNYFKLNNDGTGTLLAPNGFNVNAPTSFLQGVYVPNVTEYVQWQKKILSGYEIYEDAYKNAGAMYRNNLGVLSFANHYDTLNNYSELDPIIAFNTYEWTTTTNAETEEETHSTTQIGKVYISNDGIVGMNLKDQCGLNLGSFASGFTQPFKTLRLSDGIDFGRPQAGGADGITSINYDVNKKSISFDTPSLTSQDTITINNNVVLTYEKFVSNYNSNWTNVQYGTKNQYEELLIKLFEDASVANNQIVLLQDDSKNYGAIIAYYFNLSSDSIENMPQTQDTIRKAYYEYKNNNWAKESEEVWFGDTSLSDVLHINSTVINNTINELTSYDIIYSKNTLVVNGSQSITPYSLSDSSQYKFTATSLSNSSNKYTITLDEYGIHYNKINKESLAEYANNDLIPKVAVEQLATQIAQEIVADALNKLIQQLNV